MDVRHSGLIVKCNIGLKTLLQQDISEPVFYSDLVYKFKKNIGKTYLNDQFKKIAKQKSWIQHGYHTMVCMSGCKPNHGL